MTPLPALIVQDPAAQLNFDALSAPPEAWHEVGAAGMPGFQNGWVNFGGGLSTARFMKDPLGFVHLQGQVKNGTVITTVFTLPPGYRPAERLDPPSGGAAPPTTIAILTNGDVIPAAGNARIGFDSITFRAEQ